MKISLKKLSLAAVSICMACSVWSVPVSHAAAAPQFTAAYQAGDHVHLEWSTDMPESDVLVRNGFETSDKYNLSGAAGRGSGKQSIISSNTAAQGSRAAQVNNNHTHASGNHYWYPDTQSTYSSLGTGVVGIPQGAYFSVSYKARALSGDLNSTQFWMRGEWLDRGMPIHDQNGQPIYFAQDITFNRNAAAAFKVKLADGSTPKLDDRQLFVIVGGKAANYNYGVAHYVFDKTNSRFIPDPGTASYFFGTSNVKTGQSTTPNVDTFKVGEAVLGLQQTNLPAFPSRAVQADGQWKTFSATTYTPVHETNYDTWNRGFFTALVWSSNGVLQVDDIKFGYAQMVHLYRDGQLIYNGYLSDFEDTEAVDRTPPNIPGDTKMTVNKETRQLQLNWSIPSDNGTVYRYRLKGYPRSEAETAFSMEQPVTVTSGVKGYSVIVDQHPDTQPSGTITTTNSTWSTAMPDQRSYAHIAAVDHQGNVSPAVHLLIDDQDEPSLQFIPSTTDWTAGHVHIQAIGEDATTWVKRIGTPEQTVEGSRAVFTAIQNGTYSFTAADQFGNRHTSMYEVHNIDQIPPEISFSPVMRDWSEQSIQVQVEVSDTQSGVNHASIVYALTDNPSPPLDETQWIQTTGSSWSVPVTAEGEWYLHVRAADQVGNKVISSTDYLRIQQLPKSPELTARAMGSEQIELTWNHPEPGLTEGLKYEIHNETTGKTYTVAYPTASYIDSDLPAGVMQTYRIQAINHTGASERTEPIDVYTLPDRPAQLHIRPLDRNFTKAQVQIEPVHSAESYQITWTNTQTGLVDYEATITNNTYAVAHHLAANTLYDVAVSAVNQSGKGQPRHAGYLSLPAAPFGFQSAAVYEDQIDLQWSTVTDAVYADLQRNDESVTGNTYLSGAETNYHDTGLRSGSLYNYRLSLANTTGFGYFTQLPGIWTLPGSIQKLRTTETSETSKTLQWSAVRGANAYRLYVNQQYTGVTTDTTYTYQKLKAGQVYHFAVEAVNASGAGKPASITEATLPARPSGMKINGQSTADFRVQLAPVSGADRYTLEMNGQRYESLDGTFALSHLQAGQTYSFTVKAGNASGYSVGLNGSTMTLPAATSNIRVPINAPGHIQLEWDRQAGVDYYELWNNQGELLKKVKNPFYEDQHLKPGEWGKINIIPVNASGKGAAVSFEYQSAPDAGTIEPAAIVTIMDRGIHDAVITWKPVQGADVYHIYNPAGEPIAEVNGSTSFRIESLDSAYRYTGYSIQASNSGGRSRAYPVPAFVTLPNNEFTVDTSASRHSVQFFVQTDLENEQFVLASGLGKSKVLYKGTDQQLKISSLRADKSYTFLFWTENELGESSVPAAIHVRTAKEAQIEGLLGWNPPFSIQPSDISANDSAIANPSNKVKDLDNHTDPNSIKQVDVLDDLLPESIFKDTVNHFAEHEIRYLASLGMLKGKTADYFEPDYGITRAEFTAMLVRLLFDQQEMMSDESSVLTFQDIKPDSWYQAELKTARAHQLIDGFSPSQFAPDQMITREQAAKILNQALQIQKTSSTADVPNYADRQQIAAWAEHAVNRLTGKGLLLGYPDETFRPQRSLTRAETALIMYRAVQHGMLHK